MARAPRIIRSIAAVAAGSITWMVTALGTDVIIATVRPEWMGAAGQVKDVPVLLFVLSYALGFSVLGGWVTAWAAPRRPVLHALILGFVQLAMGLVATAIHFDMMPLWYHVTFLTLLVPANVLGGWTWMHDALHVVGFQRAA